MHFDIRNLDSERIFVRYKEDGGSEKEGLIELRKGVPDVDLGCYRYAQVRIMVDNEYYAKGLAVYSDDIPDGKDVVLNSKKSRNAPNTNIFKPIESLWSPFGEDVEIKETLGILNIVYEEEPYSISRVLASPIPFFQLKSD